MALKTIYGLTDPRDGMIRYIGQTSRQLRQRLTEHRKESSTYYRNPDVHGWILSLRADGLRPGIVAFEQTVDGGQAEARWIAEMFLSGEPILNIQRGSSNRSSESRSLSVKARLRELNQGKSHNDQARKKMSDSRRGVAKSEDHKKAIGDANRGKPKKLSAEGRERLANKAREQWRSKSPEERKHFIAKLHGKAP